MSSSDTDDLTSGEFRRLYQQEFCNRPTLADGHLLPCMLYDGHVEGECQAGPRDVREHLRDTPDSCVRNGCDLEAHIDLGGGRGRAVSSTLWTVYWYVTAVCICVALWKR